jgi:hypothetical protein
MENQNDETIENRLKRIERFGYSPEDETIEERLTRIYNKFIDYRGGVDGNGLSFAGIEVLAELRYCLTGDNKDTMKIGKL